MPDFVEITDPDDELVPGWLSLYEASFPPEVSVSMNSFVMFLSRKKEGEFPDSHLLAALQDGQFVALMSLEVCRELDVLYGNYLAVEPSLRGNGIGSACFREVVRRATDAGMRAIVFDVEIPEQCSDENRRRDAVRRIAFYRQQGALLLTGVRYIQQVPNQPPIPMHIMIRPIRPLSVEWAFEMAKEEFGDVTQIGELELA